MKRNAHDISAGRPRRGRLAYIDWVEPLATLLLAPFRMVAAVWRFRIRTALGLFDGLFYGFTGIFGLGMICFVAFGLYRVVLCPLFHHHWTAELCLPPSKRSLSLASPVFQIHELRLLARTSCSRASRYASVAVAGTR